MKPYLDVPLCPRPGCTGPLVTIEAANWNHRARHTDRLVCCACGEGSIGSLAEFERAKRADAAWVEAKRTGVM